MSKNGSSFKFNKFSDQLSLILSKKDSLFSSMSYGAINNEIYIIEQKEIDKTIKFYLWTISLNSYFLSTIPKKYYSKKEIEFLDHIDTVIKFSNYDSKPPINFKIIINKYHNEKLMAISNGLSMFGKK